MFVRQEARRFKSIWRLETISAPTRRRDLKRALALKFRDDRSAYVSGKSAFVAEIAGRAMNPR